MLFKEVVFLQLFGKIMKVTLYNKLRNYAHVGMWFSFMYSMWYYCDAITYTLDSRITGMPLASIIISTAGGFLWEWCQSFYLKTYFDWNDILRSAIGGFLGYLFYLWYPYVDFIAFWISLLFVILIIYSIGKGLKLMYLRGVIKWVNGKK